MACNQIGVQTDLPMLSLFRCTSGDIGKREELLPRVAEAGAVAVVPIVVKLDDRCECRRVGIPINQIIA